MNMKKTDFDVHFGLAFATVKQSKFESWFASMACRVFGTDFEPIKAGGKSGDKKSDGRRISTETVYQCYAPESPSKFASHAPSKICDSFPEVVTFWPKLREWIFVHNNADGLPTAASDKLEEIRTAYPSIKVSTATRGFLKDELHDKLSLQQLIDVYPEACLNFSDVQMTHVRPLLKKIVEARTTNPDPTYFGDIPNEMKLDFNNLSPDSKYHIKRARPHIDVVDRYLDRMNNPNNVSIIQFEIRSRYLELRDLGYDPDEILGKLLTFCGGCEHATYTAAAYVIVAYYLDSCDIFENSAPEIQC